MRRFIWAAIALLVFGIASAVLLAEGALHIYDRPQPLAESATYYARPSESKWQPVSIVAADGVKLDAWYFQPPQSNSGAVMLLHGVGDTRLGVMSHAQYLLDEGYSVLTPDSRGHGSSGGTMISYGVKEADDTARWLTWLGRQPGIARVYGMGESMGGAILIESLAKPSPVRAIIAECPFATFREVADYRLSHITHISSTLLWPIRELGFVYARAVYGVNLWSASAVEAIQNSRVPVFLIHGTADVNIPPSHSLELLAARPAGTELWEPQGAHHVSAISVEPREMPKRVLAWFARY